jgi:4-hydroxy-4-methyl-2-oxoglutarate aldolase
MTQPAATSTSDDDVVERLRRLDVCCVSDALDALGLDGVLEGVRPLW